MEKMQHITKSVQDFGGKECIKTLRITLKHVILVRDEVIKEEKDI